MKTKSKNFANVLRRTLSTSKLIKRQGARHLRPRDRGTRTGAGGGAPGTRSSGRPTQFATPQDMQMDVGDGLAAVLAAVDHPAVPPCPAPVRRRAVAVRRVSRPDRRLVGVGQGAMCRLGISRTWRAPAGRCPGRPGTLRPRRPCPGHVACDELAEETVGHGGTSRSGGM